MCGWGPASAFLSVADGSVDFVGDVSSAVAGAASLTDFAGGVTI